LRSLSLKTNRNQLKNLLNLRKSTAVGEESILRTLTTEERLIKTRRSATAAGMEVVVIHKIVLCLINHKKTDTTERSTIEITSLVIDLEVTVERGMGHQIVEKEVLLQMRKMLKLRN
jgi:hypothetical protein